jgi:hypothetical protein
MRDRAMGDFRAESSPNSQSHRTHGCSRASTAVLEPQPELCRVGLGLLSRPPDRNNFSTTDSGCLSRYKLDGGSQPACKPHPDHRSGSIRNARQGRASSENSWRIGVARVSPPCTCALKRYGLRRAARRYAEDSKGPQSVCQHHERMLVMLG